MKNNMDVTERISLEPAFGKDENGKDAVAIMLAADNNWAPYASVMIQSIKDNASNDRNYDIVLVGDLSNNNKKLMESMAEENIFIRVIDIRSLLEGIDLSIFATNLYYTVETYYRFFIPYLFWRYDKVLYLDVDIVVCRDVAELFDTDMRDNWWAVVKSRPTDQLDELDLWENDFLSYLREVLRMKSAFDYFQAGVMVWNVKQCINDNVYEQLIDRLAEIKTPRFVDQCVMNSIANGKHIHWLHGKWNFQWWFAFSWGGPMTAGYTEMMSCLDNAYIIHFCSCIKPWNEPHRPNADKFWWYARRSPFYETILLKKTNTEISHLRTEISHLRSEISHLRSEMGCHRNKDLPEILPDKVTWFNYNKYRLLTNITFGPLRKKYNAKRLAIKKILKTK